MALSSPIALHSDAGPGSPYPNYDCEISHSHRQSKLGDIKLAWHLTGNCKMKYLPQACPDAEELAAQRRICKK